MLIEPKREHFYTDPLEESDLLRLPILEPYDLVSPTPAESWFPGKAMVKDFEMHSSLDSINYQPDYITFWGVSSGTQYGILELKTLKKHTHLSLNEFNEQTRALGISNKLFSSVKVHKGWKRTRQLPWGLSLIE